MFLWDVPDPVVPHGQPLLTASVAAIVLHRLATRNAMLRRRPWQHVANGPEEVLVNNTKRSGKHCSETRMLLPIPDVTFQDAAGAYLPETPPVGTTEIWEIIT